MDSGGTGGVCHRVASMSVGARVWPRLFWTVRVRLTRFPVPGGPVPSVLRAIRARRWLGGLVTAGALAVAGTAAVAVEVVPDSASDDPVTTAVDVVEPSPAEAFSAGDLTERVPRSELVPVDDVRAALEVVAPAPTGTTATPGGSASESVGEVTADDDASVSASVWDELAECESSGDWSINTGNGYYGGLQFNLDSWQWAGGDRYSTYPHHATREQQIEIAERLLEIHPAGWGAWPACSAQLGLR